MPTSLSFITNTNETHKSFLINLFEQADEIIFAVGFLKSGGLQNIKEYLKDFCSDKTKSSAFYIGTGLGETDPDTLQGLYNIIKSKANHQLVLCTPDAGIFHPKIYVFKKGRMATVVTGSSNLTQHGWEINDEVSMVIETTVNSLEYLQLDKYFNQLHKKYSVDDVEIIIQRYKKEKEEHQKKFGRGPTFRFRRKKTTIAGIDMPRLKRYYELYKKDANWQRAPDQYVKAKQNLEQLDSNTKLTGLQFHKLFGPLVGHKGYKPQLWHSGNIHRTTYKTLDYPDAFREIVRTAKRNISNPVFLAFDNIITKLNQMRKAKEISGVAENIVTEILLSFNPEKFAILNDNPLAVLKWLDSKEFPQISRFKGENYADYVELLTKIRDALNMKTFIELDSFFNYINRNFIEE